MFIGSLLRGRSSSSWIAYVKIWKPNMGLAHTVRIFFWAGADRRAVHSNLANEESDIKVAVLPVSGVRPANMFYGHAGSGERRSRNEQESLGGALGAAVARLAGQLLQSAE
jgi:hypothetical protein